MITTTPIKPATRPTIMRGLAHSRSNSQDRATVATGITERTKDALSAVVCWTPR